MKKVKAKTFTLVAINGGYHDYCFSGSRALCRGFVKRYLGKAPRRIKVHVRPTMAAGYTKVMREYRSPWAVIGGDWNMLFWDAIEVLDSVAVTRKTFYFKITEAKI